MSGKAILNRVLAFGKGLGQGAHGIAVGFRGGSDFLWRWLLRTVRRACRLPLPRGLVGRWEQDHPKHQPPWNLALLSARSLVKACLGVPRAGSEVLGFLEEPAQ